MELHPILDKGVVPNKGLWYVLATEGSCPSMRVGHTCTYLKGERTGDNGKLYVIGGADPSGSFQETYVLDMNTLNWERLESTDFQARYEHTAIVPSSQKENIYVFGGANQAGNLNSVQKFETLSKSWSYPPVSGNSPSPRTFHTTVSVGDRMFIYSGGQSGSDPVSDRSVHVFDTASTTWSVLSVRGDSPKPRHGHVMVAIGNKIYLHGGMAGQTFYDDLHLLDLDKSLWVHVKRKKVYPSARAGHGACSVGDSLYIFGGMNRDGALADMYKLDTVLMSWSQVELQGPPPACRLDFGMCVVQLERPTEGPVGVDTALATKYVQDILEPGTSPQDIETGASDACVDDELEVRSADFTEKSSEDSPQEGPLKECSSDESKSGKTTLQMCLVQGGMDTEGEIFDDTLVMLLP
ncbi:hypothetical protein ScPMuIL_011277 [Solemya velum]